MRKVLSLVLALALVLGSFGMAYAAPMSDVKGEKFEDAVNVLTELGVVNGYPDGTYKPANIVTRGEMAKIVICALGLEDYAAGTSAFSDMAGHWSDKYVAYAVSLGIINGYPDGTFKADNTVTYDEAAKMLVAALGYTEDALVGSWPANWVTKAKVLGIIKGVQSGSVGANRGDIAIMTYQTLDQSIGKTDKDGVWSPTIVKAGPPAEYDLMLDRLDAQLYAPGGAATAGDPFVLTATRADAAVANVKELVGSYVTAYANSDNEIIAVKEVKSTFLTGKFTTLGTAGTVANNDVFEADDVEYKVALIASAVTPEELVNGEDLTIAPAFAANVEYKIAADISGKKIKEVYSISAWSIDDAFQFEDGKMDDESLGTEDFKLDDNDEIDLGSFALFGVNSLEDIDEDNIVYVYSDTVGITRIDVGTEVVKGEVTKINSTGSKVTVGGKAYEMSAAPGANGADWATLKLESDVIFYLDYAGDVYELEIVEAKAENYAILLETDDGASGLSGKDGLVKLLLADGTDKIFSVDGDLAVAGVIAKNGVWNDGTVGVDYTADAAAGTIVKYGLNKDGEVDALTVFPTATMLAVSVVTDTEVTAKGYFDSKAVASDVMVFTYDGASSDGSALKADEEKYGIATLSQIKGKEYDDVQYLYDNDAKQIAVMVIFGEGTGDEDVYGLVTGWFNTVDSSTDMMVTVLVDGVEEEYELTTAGHTAITAAGFNEDLLQMLEFTASGQVKGTVEVDADGVGEATKADWVVAGGVITSPGGAYDKGVIKIGAGATEHTVDSGAIAYKWDAAESEFTKKAVSKSNLADGVNVHLYDLDEDGVIDIILFW